MAKNVTLMGASYADVPSVLLPQTGGGTAEFTDTSDADATAGDIASGKTAYVNGVKLTGTGSGGGGTTWTTLHDGNLWITSSSPNYILINNYYTPFASGETYRVTWGSDTFIFETASDGGQSYDGYFIGNPGVVGGTDDGSGATFFIYRDRADRAVGATTDASGSKYVKIEKQVSGGGGSADLRSLTVTPSADTQVFDGNNVWNINKSNTAITSNQIIYIFDMKLSSVPLVSGQTYAVTGSWERTGKSKTYNVNTSVTWNGSGTTIAISTFTGTFGVDADGSVKLTISVTSTDEDAESNPLVLHFASNSSFDGFDEVIVNPVSVATGTFKGTTTGAAIDVPLNYSGSGYPIAVIIYPAEGPYNSSSGSFYSTIQRYAAAYYSLVKSEISSSPTYASTGNNNSAVVTHRYKSSTSSATSYNQTSGAVNMYRNVNASTGGTNGQAIVKIKSKTVLSVYIASNSYGFMANIDYKYWVLYSS